MATGTPVDPVVPLSRPWVSCLTSSGIFTKMMSHVFRKLADRSCRWGARVRWIGGLLLLPLMALEVSGQSDPCQWSTLYKAASTIDCSRLFIEPAALGTILQQVGTYTSTYVIVYADRLGFRIESIDDPVLSGLRVGFLNDATTRPVLDQYGIFRIQEYPADPQGVCRLFRDLMTGNVDAAVLWAPLAGYFAGLMDVETQLNMTTVAVRTDRPQIPILTTHAAHASGDAVMACAQEVQGVLEGYGVVPVEMVLAKTEQTAIPENLTPPPEDPRAIEEGWRLYHLYCDRCHGIDAVSGGLAPDLRKSFRRLSYADVVHTVLNGRVAKGMPSWRGILDLEKVTLIYQYVRARSQNRVGPGRPQLVKSH